MPDIKFIKVKGSCMTPTLCDKTLVPFKAATFLDIAPEDIAVLKIKGEYMIHRIIDKIQIGRKRFFIHKGDATKILLVAPACVLVGKAILEQARLGYLRRADFPLVLKVALIKFKLWLKQLIIRE
jgi:hypothetical protein